jgi:hydroxyacylglutathione hydrolase
MLNILYLNRKKNNILLQLVYCGHEYTKKNLEFAATVEPENQDLKTKQSSLKSVTIPSTIGDELKFNPFMRTNQASVQAYTGKTDVVECMAELRDRKNKF